MGEAAQTLKEKAPFLNTLIITSEDPYIITKTKTDSFRKIYSEWKFVYNTADKMQGTGSATGLTLVQADQQHQVEEVILSAFVSLHLQMRTRYLLAHLQSSWIIMLSLFHENDQVTVCGDRRTHLMLPNTREQYFC